MGYLRVLLLIAIGFGMAACGGKQKAYNGPEVTQIQVHKADRKMYLIHGSEVLQEYDIGLGFMPVGHKQFEGDGKTPEGAYYISHRNPKSAYHLSLGISYPNDDDRSFAAENNKPAGGDIFIHGGPPRKVNIRDWTAGCIAVTDKEIEAIYAMVKPGTPIFIMP